MHDFYYTFYSTGTQTYGHMGHNEHTIEVLKGLEHSNAEKPEFHVSQGTILKQTWNTEKCRIKKKENLHS